MNQAHLALLAATALALCAACNSNESEGTVEAAPTELAQRQPARTVPAGQPTGHPASTPSPGARTADRIVGTVLETVDSGGYTYVRVDTGQGAEEVWAAGPPTVVSAGDQVSFDASLPMPGFYSPTLDRTFEQLYFTGAIEPGAIEAAPAAAQLAATVELPEGGVTVAEIFARRDELVGQQVVFRGEVVKFNAQILGKNWLHVRDGSGEEGSNDLTVTTSATASVGDLVLVRGLLASDRDFGAGYVYDLIVEDAELVRD